MLARLIAERLGTALRRPWSSRTSRTPRARSAPPMWPHRRQTAIRCCWSSTAPSVSRLSCRPISLSIRSRTPLRVARAGGRRPGDCRESFGTCARQAIAAARRGQSGQAVVRVAAAQPRHPGAGLNTLTASGVLAAVGGARERSHRLPLWAGLPRPRCWSGTAHCRQWSRRVKDEAPAVIDDQQRERRRAYFATSQLFSKAANLAVASGYFSMNALFLPVAKLFQRCSSGAEAV